MSSGRTAILSRKVNFLLLTFGVSTALVFGMALSSREASDRGGTFERAAALQEAPPPVQEDRVVTAQRERDLAVPPAPKGADPALFLPNIADIAERANASVVNIRATEIIRTSARDRRRSPHGTPFDFIFPRPDRPAPRDPGGEEDDDQRQDSGGSGFVVTEDGYIMTNYHVIEDADRIIVRLAEDNHDYEASVVGTDQLTDLALLKIEPRQRLPYIPLGDSERLRVGEWVIAIGNPLVYDHTVTVGVVSAKGRKLAGLSRDVSLDNYIQTDAAINRGNSGGPLLNVKGEAVGINSAISVAGQGISFAIPINMARDVMTQLREKGKVSRGYLGVTIQDIQSELRPDERDYFGLQGRKGAFIQNVTPGEPADRAGLQPGDAIVSVDGQTITGSDDLIRTISAKIPGSRVSLGIVRDGQDRKLTAELTNRPDRTAVRASREEEQEDPEEPVSDKRLGMTVEDITSETRRELKISDDVQGVVVTHVSQVSDAWDRGLREGDVIVKLNRKAIRSLDDYRAIVDSLKPGEMLSMYVRNPQVDTGRFVNLPVGAE
ncbi:MAG TPA: Do family serine endopeptidase [Candidatus Polarisedimenticolia bacterium]|nr:Do family serine endopeptidase [Candidatus Polarisedimenticolia bacterium]